MKEKKIYKYFYKSEKRALDIILSLLIFILSIPLLVIFSVWIWIETGQFPIYSQKRGLVLEKNLFRLYKIRTLKTSDQRRLNLTGIFIKEELEEFVTPLGRWLRKTGLDELPQLLNVVAGNMSIVGPRPFSLNDIERMKLNDPLFYKRRGMINSKPGITGLWQIKGDRLKGSANLLELEEYYDINKNLLLDIKILILTIPVVLLGNNSDAILMSKRNAGKNHSMVNG
jgi:lipopolysaccharide/colanic/teichoic acid biosynthesis glycosyltransferase